MAVEIASAYVSIIPTTKGIAGNLEKELVGPMNAAAKKAGDEAGATMKQSLDKASASFTKFGIGALAVGGAIGVGLFKAGQAASDLGESVNAVKVTFGTAANGILKLGEDAAKTVGLSNAAFNSLAVQFSAFATTVAGKGGDVVGTLKDLTGRAADFASVMNIEVKDAATLFQSGLAGETEPLRKYGIDLSAAAVQAFAAANGIGTLGAQLTEAEKVTARYGLLMQSTSKTQGDFANTSDSAANAMRIAKAEIENATASLGSSLAPAMATAAGAVASLADKFAGLNEATGGWLSKALGIGAVALGAVGGISLIIGQTLKMTTRFTEAKDAISTLTTKFPNLGSAIKGGLVPALALAGLAVFAIQKHMREVEISNAFNKQRVDAFTEALRDGADAAEAYDKALSAEGKLEFIDASDAKVKDLTATLVRSGLTFDEFKGHLNGSKEEFEAWARSINTAGDPGSKMKLNDLNHLLQTGFQLMEQLAEATQQRADQAKAHGTVLEGERHGLDQVSTAGDKAAETEAGLAAATEEATKKSDAFADALQRQQDKLEDLYGREYDAVQAKYDFADAQAAQMVAVDEFNTVLGDNKSKQEDVEAAQRTATDAILDQAEKYATLDGAALGSQGAIQRQIASLEAQRDSLAPGSPLRVFLDQYIADLAAIPSNVSTVMDLSISAGQVTTAAGDVIGVRFGARARGGQASGRTLVGEEGPEFVDLPQGSFVHTAQATRAMMSATSSLAPVGGNASLIGTFNNNRRDIGVGDLNQILAMARLAA